MAREWGVHVGDRITAGFLGSVRVVGIAVAPDNVAFPLSSVPHVYVSNAWIERLARLAPGRQFFVNEALIWANDPTAVDVLLQQARATSTGIANVRFLTRSGVRVLIDSAAGIVIALLVAFSLVALAAAGVMLAAGRERGRPAAPADDRHPARDRRVARGASRRVRDRGGARRRSPPARSGWRRARWPRAGRAHGCSRR